MKSRSILGVVFLSSLVLGSAHAEDDSSTERTQQNSAAEERRDDADDTGALEAAWLEEIGAAQALLTSRDARAASEHFRRSLETARRIWNARIQLAQQGLAEMPAIRHGDSTQPNNVEYALSAGFLARAMVESPGASVADLILARNLSLLAAQVFAALEGPSSEHSAISTQQAQLIDRRLAQIEQQLPRPERQYAPAVIPPAYDPAAEVRRQAEQGADLEMRSYEQDSCAMIAAAGGWCP
jgi:hypothetical protein